MATRPPIVVFTKTLKGFQGEILPRHHAVALWEDHKQWLGSWPTRERLIKALDNMLADSGEPEHG